jgi:hypothetical protein
MADLNGRQRRVARRRSKRRRQGKEAGETQQRMCDDCSWIEGGREGDVDPGVVEHEHTYTTRRIYQRSSRYLLPEKCHAKESKGCFSPHERCGWKPGYSRTAAVNGRHCSVQGSKDKNKKGERPPQSQQPKQREQSQG